MCGIVAYVGDQAAAPLVFHALMRLEYRGYDSAGIAVRTPDGRSEAEHTVEGVTALASLLVRPDLQTSGAAIGHTRWATHGEVSQRNAHPLSDCTSTLHVAHNGVIENAGALREELVASGHHFAGEVDSEVVVHLIEEGLGRGASLVNALERAIERLEGSWAIVALDAVTGHVAATAQRSPLVVASSAHGVFLASDINAVADDVDEYQVLVDGDVVNLTLEGIAWRHGGTPRPEPARHAVRWKSALAAGGQHADHMGNEIDEQPLVAARVLDAMGSGIADGALWRALGLPALRRIDRVVVLGCGTSLHAGRAIGSVFSRLGGIPATPVIASESATYVAEPRTLVIAISQSGETADILRALDAFPPRERALLALTNNPSSSLARAADAVIDCHAGPEVGVAATKTFVAQVMTGVAVALSGLAAGNRIDGQELRSSIDALVGIPDRLTAALELWGAAVPPLVKEFEDAEGYLFLGRGTGLVYAAEGALKLKELTYRWAEHQPAGELKHGPLALVDAGTPVFVVDSGDRRIDVNIAEVAARGGRVVRLGDGEQAPAWGPLESVVPLQLFARAMALRLGRNVDKPRNLAKSVTVD